MKFCPGCGQDLSVVVPQDHRIPPEDVLAQEEVSQDAPAPPPLFNTIRQAEGGAPRQEASGPLSGIPRKWQVAGLLGCGGMGLLLLALVVVGIVSSASNNTVQSGGGQESGESKNKSNESKNKRLRQ